MRQAGTRAAEDRIDEIARTGGTGRDAARCRSRVFHSLMSLATGDLYGPATFWATVAAASVAIPSTVAIMWVTVRVGRPKRRLLYRMLVSAPLISADQHLRHGLEVRRDGRLLTDPHIVSIELSNQGRVDIARSAFDGAEPLRLDVGAPIIDVLSSATTPADRAIPSARADRNMLKIGPGLIASRQKVVYSLLLDGATPGVTCAAPELIDTDVRRQDPDSDPSGSAHAMAIISLIFGTMSLLLLAVPAVPAIILGHVARRRLRHTTGSGARLALAGLILGYITLLLLVSTLVLTLGLNTTG